MLFYRWASVADGCSTLNQHCVKVSCLLGVHLSVPFGVYSLFTLQDLVSRRIHIKTACDVPVAKLTTYISPAVTKRYPNVVSTPWRRRGR